MKTQAEITQITKLYLYTIDKVNKYVTEHVLGGLIKKRPFHELFYDTLETTKFMSKILDTFLEDCAEILDVKFKVVNTTGYDYLYKSYIRVEHKMTNCSGEKTSVWLANKYQNKSDMDELWLLTYKIDPITGVITHMGLAVVYADTCDGTINCMLEEQKKRNGKKADGTPQKGAFLSIKCVNSDYDKIDVIFGIKRKARKYIQIWLKSIDDIKSNVEI